MNIRIDSKKAKKQRAKEQRMSRLLGKDLCACGSSMLCDGKCRESHSNGIGVVSCTSWYRLDPPRHVDKKRGRKRTVRRDDAPRSDKEISRERFHEKRRRGKD